MSTDQATSSPSFEAVMPDADTLSAAVFATMELARGAMERLPGERAAAKTDLNPLMRQYRQGLVDGMEEAIQNVLLPLVKAFEAKGSGYE